MKKILLALLAVPIVMWGYGKLGVLFEMRGLVAENTALKAQIAAIKGKPVAQAPPLSPWLLNDKSKDKKPRRICHIIKSSVFCREVA